jgi:hypothetical protein
MELTSNETLKITRLQRKNHILDSKLGIIYDNIDKVRFTRPIVNLKINIICYKLERNIKRIENLKIEVKKIIESYERRIEAEKIAHQSLFEEKKIGEKTIKRQEKIIEKKTEDFVFVESDINLTNEKPEGYEEEDFIYDFVFELDEEPVNKTIKRQEKIIEKEQEIKILKSNLTNNN